MSEPLTDTELAALNADLLAELRALRAERIPGIQNGTIVLLGQARAEVTMLRQKLIAMTAERDALITLAQRVLDHPVDDYEGYLRRGALRTAVFARLRSCK